MASQSNYGIYSRSRQPSELTSRVRALLSRYPNLSGAELGTLIAEFPYVPILDVGLMTADDGLAEKFAAFHRDHKNALKPRWSSLAAFLWFPIVVATALIWWLVI